VQCGEHLPSAIAVLDKALENEIDFSVRRLTEVRILAITRWERIGFDKGESEIVHKILRSRHRRLKTDQMA